jgi:hypothetical protein
MEPKPKNDMVKTGVVIATAVGLVIYTQITVGGLKKRVTALEDEVQTMAKYIKLLESTISSRMHANASNPNPPNTNHPPVNNNHNSHSNPNPPNTNSRSRGRRDVQPVKPRVVVIEEEEFSDTEEDHDILPAENSLPARAHVPVNQNTQPMSNRRSRVNEVNQPKNFEKEELLHNPPPVSNRRSNRKSHPPKAVEFAEDVHIPKDDANEDDTNSMVAGLASSNNYDNDEDGKSKSAAQKTKDKADQMKKSREARLERIKANSKGK